MKKEQEKTKLLLLLPSLHPFRNHNSNLALRVAKHIEAEASISTFCMEYNSDGSFKAKSYKNTPTNIDDIPVSFAKINWFDRFIAKCMSKIIDTDPAHTLVASCKLFIKSIRQARRADIVLSSYHTIVPPLAASMLRGKKNRLIKALYLMDPSEAMYNNNLSINDEGRLFLKILKNTDIIFTTPFIRDAMVSKGYTALIDRIVDISFPMITGFYYTPQNQDAEKITLLYCGSLYLKQKIRSPEYFLKVISHLDSRFRVLFVGRESKDMLSQFPIETAAEVVALTHMAHDSLMQVMADADILINIGNAVPVHLPSKTLEYINTGKPIVNFYKFDDCPTLSYTRRYPLCLNMNENNTDICTQAEAFSSFCLHHKGKSLSQEWIQQNFSDSIPSVIANRIMEHLSELRNDVQ